MKAKWYISTLFLLLFIVFGAFQEQVHIPNQEIVVEFVDGKVNNKNIKNTIANVREKLLKVGVKNIKIKETKKGVLRISYHSVINVEHIKEALFEEGNLPINENKKEDLAYYNIGVYEIQDIIDASKSHDNCLLEIKLNSDRTTPTYTIAFVKNLEILKANALFKTKLKATSNSGFVKNNTSYKEPEVRAGPYKLFI
ncbi:hypothetical protein [Polaribacter porphyrae]|uniref:Uncharacterized protein n=1 Tax=Polaribacter porphyrae TaxID=1137780 RepID=A0A2S7WNZ0_9FLAO|nr:hypothetical protein [Polaribacter porphyrae]PQJ79327.1 hypothetical protein BTO18_09145 [Polaribacter porphyrae]